MAEDQAALQQQVQQLQMMAQQLQQIAQQRQQLEAMQKESQHAIETLEALDAGAAVYRNVGSLLVQEKGKDDAITRLKDDLETLEIRVKRAKGQEEQMKEQLEELQNKLQAAFGKQ